jgi:hypothetical protein
MVGSDLTGFTNVVGAPWQSFSIETLQGSDSRVNLKIEDKYLNKFK